MISPQPSFESPEQSLLKTILQPLLADFAHWFDRSIQLLETESMSFLTVSDQNNLLAKVKNAQQEVRTAQMLFNAPDGQVGIEPSTMLTWHKLVGECWQVSARFRQSPPSDLQPQ